MLPHVDDSPMVQSLKLRLWNVVSTMQNTDLKDIAFEQIVQELKAIEAAWLALEGQESEGAT